MPVPRSGELNRHNALQPETAQGWRGQHDDKEGGLGNGKRGLPGDLSGLTTVKESKETTGRGLSTSGTNLKEAG